MLSAATLRDDYVAALCEPDARRARGLISAALENGADPESVYLDVLAPALHEIGLRWERPARRRGRAPRQLGHRVGDGRAGQPHARHGAGARDGRGGVRGRGAAPAREPRRGRLPVIGDVAGKGVEAAAVMGQVRSAIRAYALDEPDPSQVMARTNRIVEREGQMVTALMAVLDPRTRTLRHAGAGHLPPLLVGAGGDAGFLERLRTAAGTGDLEELCDALLATAPSGRARDDVALLACQLAR